MIRFVDVVFSLALAIHAAWAGDSITESSPNNGVTQNPVWALCDLACPGVETCTESGEYTNSVASAPDPVGNGPEYTCASNGFMIRNLGDSGDQQTVEGGTRYEPHLVRGKPVTGSVTASACTVDSDCAAGERCIEWSQQCAIDYDVIILHYGHNDNRSGVGPPGQLGADGETAEFIWEGCGACGIRQQVDDLCDMHKKTVILVSVNPWRGGGGWDGAKEARRATLNGLMAAYAAAGGPGGRCTGRIYYVDTTAYVSHPTLGAEYLAGSVGGDAIHPDSATCLKLGEAVFTEARAAFPP